jgi:hypothetical protein
MRHGNLPITHYVTSVQDQHRLVCECGAEKLVLSLLKNFTSSAVFLSALDGFDTMKKYLIKFDDKDYMMAALCSCENEV